MIIKHCLNCKMNCSESFDVCPACGGDLIIREEDNPIVEPSSCKERQYAPTASVAKIWGLVGVCVLAIFLMIQGFAWLNGDDKDDNYVCSSCHRTFTNRDDTKSIAYTSMCEPCYDNFKFKQDLQEEIKKYQERIK